MSQNIDLSITEKDKQIPDDFRKAAAKLEADLFVYDFTKMDGGKKNLPGNLKDTTEVYCDYKESLTDIENLQTKIMSNVANKEDVERILAEASDKDKLKQAILDEIQTTIMQNDALIDRYADIGINKKIFCFILYVPFIFPGLLLRKFFIRKEAEKSAKFYLSRISIDGYVKDVERQSKIVNTKSNQLTEDVAKTMIKENNTKATMERKKIYNNNLVQNLEMIDKIKNNLHM